MSVETPTLTPDRQPDIDEREMSLLEIGLNQGDTEALGQFYKENYRALFHYAMRLVRNHETAEDIVQTAFCKIWERYRGSYEDRGYKPTALFHRAITNLAIDLSKEKAKYNLAHIDDESLDWHLSRYAADRYTEIPDLIAADEIVEELLASLSPAFADTARIVLAEGKSYQQCADELGIRLGTVQSRVSRARRDLKEYIEESGLLEELDRELVNN